MSAIRRYSCSSAVNTHSAVHILLRTSEDAEQVCMPGFIIASFYSSCVLAFFYSALVKYFSFLGVGWDFHSGFLEQCFDIARSVFFKFKIMQF